MAIVSDLAVLAHTRVAKAGIVTNRFNTLALVMGDLAVVLASAVIALSVRGFLASDAWSGALNPIDLSVVAAWLLCLQLNGAYRTNIRVIGLEEYKRVLTASLTTAAVVGIAAYLTKYELARGFYLALFAIGIPALLAFRFAARRVMQQLRLRGYQATHVLLAGEPRKIDEIAAVLRREKMLGFEAVGALVPTNDPSLTTPGGIPVVGCIVEAIQVAGEANAEAVIFAEGAFASSADFRRTAWDFESSKTHMIFVPSFTDVAADRLSLRPVGGLPLINVEAPQAVQAGRWFKRAFDVVGSLLLIIASAPIMLATALAIKLEDGGPVIFKQTRVGKGGDAFGCYKFRSMCVDAEARLAALQRLNEGNGVLFKMARDPRITRVGAFIRRFSIDEVPQFFNVLKGEMSLVGPRPALPSEVANYEPDVLRRLAVRPGLTGLWQVSGRSDLCWDETVRLDLYYVDNWSIVQDLAILARTFNAVFGSRGAY